MSPNHLAKETSTYLLQHANNPVDWYPWSQEALSRSKEEDKPILLSIGYAACHWCHVMEHESFEDDETAQLMNEYFVCIKVDREERPDLDDIYMKSVQIMSGHGGWPMTVFLTPELKPFFGGTYFPPVDRHGLPSFKKLLTGVNAAWQTKRKEIEKSASELTDHLLTLDQFITRPQEQSQVFNQELILQAVQKFLQYFDKKWGGFGHAPKFPPTASLELAMRALKAAGSLKADLQEMINVTLDSMANGGIHDQIGGGFARYSTDEKWLVPHFEKMLYDNALLAKTYFAGYLLTGRSYWLRVAENILSFTTRELLTKEGAFYSSLDADSEGVEGKFYVWTSSEIEKILGSDSPFLCQVYGVSEAGNFEHGTNILHLVDSPEILAQKFDLTTEQFWSKLDPLNKKLLQARSKRIRPGTDKKVLTSWTSLMISAYIDGFQITGKNEYLICAKKAADFILKEMSSDSRLLHTWGEGQAKLNGYLDDYTYFVQALLDLASADCDPQWLNKAILFTDHVLEHFKDEQSAKFFYTSNDHESLLLRPQSHFDGPVPSPSSIAVFNLLRLGRITNKTVYTQTAHELLSNYQTYFKQAPEQFASLISAFDLSLNPMPDIVLTLPETSSTSDLLLEVEKHFLPNKVLILKRYSAKQNKEELLLLRDKNPINERPTLFICQNFACQKPITEVEELNQALKIL